MNGVHVSGLILVTLNWRLAAPELRSIVQDCEPAVFIFESRYAAAATELRAARLTDRFICIGEGPAWAERYEDIAATGDASGPARRAVRMIPRC